MRATDVVRSIEAVAPPYLAEEWDNVGLLVGDAQANVRKLMLCVDLTETVLAEAQAEKVQMVVAYHPVIFRPISRVTAAETPVLYAAARHGIAVYSTHTAFDSAPGGTNDVLADALGLSARRPLKPTVCTTRHKVVVFVPPADMPQVSAAAFGAGAGQIGDYSECAFFSHGIGVFRGADGTHPAVGRPGRHEANEEVRLEFVTAKPQVPEVCRAIRQAHPYEEPAVDVYPLVTCLEGSGLGRVGRLPRAMTTQTLITRIKKVLKVPQVLMAARPAPSHGKRRPAASSDGKGALVTWAACGAGACGPLYQAAVAAGATFYLTGEMRHHDALAAAQAGLTAVCLGHSNSERLALRTLADRIKVTLPKLTILRSVQDKDPFRIV